MTSLIALEPSAVRKAIERSFAVRAKKAVGPADLGQRLLALCLRSVVLKELGHGEHLLELNGVAPQDTDGICLPHQGMVGLPSKPAA